MSIQIHSFKLGMTACFLLQGQKSVLIDCGTPKQLKRFEAEMAGFAQKPGDIELIVITHGHMDHVGSARDIKALTGAKLAMHRLEVEWLEKSMNVMPPGATGWGRLMSAIGRAFAPLTKFPSTSVDLPLTDEGLTLEEYGIPGRILHTPGHSPGSVSLLLETGEAFVGDLAMNGLPMRFGPGMPVFAEDPRQVKESWKRILDQGARMIYPSHGKPFAAEALKKAL